MVARTNPPTFRVLAAWEPAGRSQRPIDHLPAEVTVDPSIVSPPPPPLVEDREGALASGTQDPLPPAEKRREPSSPVPVGPRAEEPAQPPPAPVTTVPVEAR